MAIQPDVGALLDRIGEVERATNQQLTQVQQHLSTILDQTPDRVAPSDSSLSGQAVCVSPVPWGFWYVVKGDPGVGGVSFAGADWRTQFDNYGLTGWIQFKVPTSAGEFSGLPSGYGYRAQLLIETPSPLSIPAFVSGSSGGGFQLQLWVNEVLSAIVAAGNITLNIPAGRSVITLVVRDTDTVEFWAGLFTGVKVETWQ